MKENFKTLNADSEHQILFVFAGVRRILNRMAVEKFKAINLGFQQAIILRELVFENTPTSTELALKTTTDPAALSRIISSLEKKGFLKRKNMKEDRRSWSLECTASGKTIAEQVNTIYEEIDDLLKESLSQKEQGEFVHLLRKIADFLTKKEIYDKRKSES